jgi:hypothetical protein
MLVSIEAAIDGCVKADGRIAAVFLSEFSSLPLYGAFLGTTG